MAVFACVVGFLHVYPDLRFRRENVASASEGIPFWAASDEGTYLSRVARAASGEWRLGNVMIYEHRNDPWIYGQAGEVLEGRMVAWLGRPVAAMDVWWTLFMPMVVVVIAYCWFFRLTHSSSAALLVSGLIALGQYLVSKDSPLLHGRLIQPEWVYPLQLVRPVSPQFYIVPFLLALWAFSELFGGGSRWWDVVAGMSQGVLFYTNLFFWGFVLVGVGLLVMLTIGQRRWVVFRRFLAALALAGLCAVAYAWNMAQAMQHPNYTEATLRLGLHASRHPILPLWHVAVAAAFFGLGWPHRRERWYPVIGAFLIGGFICLNQQLVTGKMVTPFHWETQTNKILLQCALVLIAWAALRRFAEPMRRRLQAVFCGVGVVLLLAHGFMLQSQYYRLNQPAWTALQPLGRPLAWLKKHTQSSDVVMINPLHYEWAEYVTALGGNYTYISESFSHASFLSRQEIEERFLGALHWFGATTEEAAGFIRWNSGAHFLGLAALPWYVPTPPERLKRYTDSLIARYDNQAKQVQSAWDYAGKYKLDYVLMTKEEALRAGGTASIRRGEQVYSDGYFVIWRIAHP